MRAGRRPLKRRLNIAVTFHGVGITCIDMGKNSVSRRWPVEFIVVVVIIIMVTARFTRARRICVSISFWIRSNKTTITYILLRNDNIILTRTRRVWHVYMIYFIETRVHGTPGNFAKRAKIKRNQKKKKNCDLFNYSELYARVQLIEIIIIISWTQNEYACRV